MAMRLAVMNLVIEVIDEACDGAVGSDGPPGPDVQESRGIEIQRICVLPVKAVILGDVFAIVPDCHPATIIDVRHGGAVATRMLSLEIPGPASIAVTRG